MPDLPTRPSMRQLRNQAKDLLRAANDGDGGAVDRIHRYSERLTLTSAQLTLAREYGFPSWVRLKTEVERRRLLDQGDIAGLGEMLAGDPSLAVETMEQWCDHPRGAAPLNYVAMLRYDTTSGRWRNVEGTAGLARRLIDAGAPVDGRPQDPEPPLITAASYGDVDVARVLLENGADVDKPAGPDAGVMPGGTALGHAAIFGMTEVVDLLSEWDAHVASIEEAAAVGDITGWLIPQTDSEARTRALVMASDHQRLDVIDQLISSGVPVDATDHSFGRQPLRIAAQNGRPHSVRRLLHHGADPHLRDLEHHRTPLEWCRHGRLTTIDTSGHDQVEEVLLDTLSR